MPDDSLFATLLQKAKSIGPPGHGETPLPIVPPEDQSPDVLMKLINLIGDPIGGIMPGMKAASLPVLGKKALPLAMDEASRMKRAAEMGYTMDVFHGTAPKAGVTTGKFNEFEYLRPYGDAGIHVDPDPRVGNIGASSAVTLNTKDFGFEPADYATGAQVLPLKAKIQNPLDLPDMSAWKDPVEWRDRLQMHGVLQKAAQERPELLPVLRALEQGAKGNAAEMMYPPKGTAVATHQQQLMTGWAEQLRNILKQHGHDSIRYGNIFEGTGKPSYMLLDPNQLRSRFAAFDPTRAKSGDLLASLAAMVWVGGAGAISRGDDDAR